MSARRASLSTGRVGLSGGGASLSVAAGMNARIAVEAAKVVPVRSTSCNLGPARAVEIIVQVHTATVIVINSHGLATSDGRTEGTTLSGCGLVAKDFPGNQDRGPLDGGKLPALQPHVEDLVSETLAVGCRWLSCWGCLGGSLARDNAGGLRVRGWSVATRRKGSGIGAGGASETIPTSNVGPVIRVGRGACGKAGGL